MQWGAQKTWLCDIAKETGETPKALRQMVEVEEHLCFMWNAFWALSGDRQIGATGGVSRIPFVSIDRYAARRGIDDRGAFDRFHLMLTRMDAAFIAHMAQGKPVEGDGGAR